LLSDVEAGLLQGGRMDGVGVGKWECRQTKRRAYVFYFRRKSINKR